MRTSFHNLKLKLCIRETTKTISDVVFTENLIQLNSCNSNLQGDSKFVRITWVLELWEFRLFRQNFEKISRGCFLTMQSVVQAKVGQYIQILFIRNVYIFINNNIVKIYKHMRIRILQLRFFKKSLIEDCLILSNLLWFILFETFRSKESKS